MLYGWGGKGLDWPRQDQFGSAPGDYESNYIANIGLRRRETNALNFARYCKWVHPLLPMLYKLLV